MVDEEVKQSFARDVCLLRYVGIRVVVVHGGGSSDQPRCSIASGSTPPSAEACASPTMPRWIVVEMVLGGGVTQEIVGMICEHGGRAVGLSGKDDSLHARYAA